jgi:transposase
VSFALLTWNIAQFREDFISFSSSSSPSSFESEVSPKFRTGVEYEQPVKEKESKTERKLRRYYDEEFKRDAVEMLESGERSAVEVARELGVSDCSLGKWKRRYGKEGPGAAAEAAEERIKSLERELERVSRQRDILKKALGILGQEPGSSTK